MALALAVEWKLLHVLLQEAGAGRFWNLHLHHKLEQILILLPSKQAVVEHLELALILHVRRNILLMLQEHLLLMETNNSPKSKLILPFLLLMVSFLLTFLAVLPKLNGIRPISSAPIKRFPAVLPPMLKWAVCRFVRKSYFPEQMKTALLPELLLPEAVSASLLRKLLSEYKQSGQKKK